MTSKGANVAFIRSGLLYRRSKPNVLTSLLGAGELPRSSASPPHPQLLARGAPAAGPWISPGARNAAGS